MAPGELGAASQPQGAVRNGRKRAEELLGGIWGTPVLPFAEQAGGFWWAPAFPQLKHEGVLAVGKGLGSPTCWCGEMESSCYKRYILDVRDILDINRDIP